MVDDATRRAWKLSVTALPAGYGRVHQHGIFAVWRQTQIGGMVAGEQEERQRDQSNHDGGWRQGHSPAVLLCQPRRGRQKHQLSSGTAGAQDAKNEAAMKAEPARRDRRGQDQGRHAGRNAENNAEAEPHLPFRGHDHGQRYAHDQQKRGAGQNGPRTIAQYQCPGERRDHAKQRHPKAQRP